MNPDIEHSFEDDILTLVLKNDYTLAELLESLESNINRYAPDTKLGVLFDVRLSNSDRSITEVQAVMPEFAKWKGKVVRFAVLVDSNFLFGLTNQARVYAEGSGLEAHPFRELEPARAWLREKLL